MNEKTGLQLPTGYSSPPRARRGRLHPALIGALLLAGLYFLGTSVASYRHRSCSRHRSGAPNAHVDASEVTANLTTAGKVPLEVHIMSKCPDAQVCLRDLIVPAMEDIADKVDFQLSYIGRLSGDSYAECMHGASECLGNIVELCAAELHPDPKIHLGFTMCLTADYPHIPEHGLVQQCALEHGVDFDALNDCASRDEGQHGWDLLRASIARSRDAGVAKSCTVRLAGKVRCIRDGGQWKECDDGAKPKDLVRDVTKAAS